MAFVCERCNLEIYVSYVCEKCHRSVCRQCIELKDKQICLDCREELNHSNLFQLDSSCLPSIQDPRHNCVVHNNEVDIEL